jgi:hypothetical protein
MKTLQALVLQCSGQIENCQFHDLDNLYCRYSFIQGPDWSIIGVYSLFTAILSYNSQA